MNRRSVLDTSALIEVLRGGPKAPAVTATMSAAENLSDLIIPTIVVAELLDPQQIQVFRAVIEPRIQVYSFDVEHAEKAAAIALAARGRRTGTCRQCTKTDWMIAGFADAIGATWLLTTNPHDFLLPLNSVQSSVQVIDAGELNALHSQGNLPLK